MRVALFVAALTGVTGVLFGMTPAWHAARAPLVESLAAGRRTSIGGAGRIRMLLAVGEVAGAVLLLAGAGLLLRTLASMTAEDAGFHAESVLTMSVSLPISRYPDQTHALNFFRRADAALAALPGVQSVGFVDNLPRSRPRDISKRSAFGSRKGVPSTTATSRLLRKSASSTKNLCGASWEDARHLG